MRLYTSLRYQRKTKIEKIIRLTVKWCISKWGTNKRRFNRLVINIDWDRNATNCGEYVMSDNTITIFVHSHKNIRDLIDTIIHEFTHQRQTMSYYWKLHKTHGYSKHPYEIEACDVAKYHRKDCWYSIKSKV